MPSHFTILGGRGYVGSYFARFLDGLGIPYWVPERDDSSLFGKDLGCVIYCIGMTQDFARKPIATLEAHVVKLTELLRDGQFQSLIYLSSTRLFDGLSGCVTEDSDLHLNPGKPRHLFDLSKAAGESLCCAMTNIDAISVRLSTVYDDDLAGRCFLHDVIKRSLELGDAPVDLDTNLNIERDYVHIEDVCQALLQLADGHSSRIYNLASGVNVSNRELFSLIEARTGRVFRAAEGVVGSVPTIDIGRMRREFGWAPRHVPDWLMAVFQKANGSKAGDGTR